MVDALASAAGARNASLGAEHQRAVSTAAGNSFFDDSINSAQRENDDEGDVDDPEAIVSEESEEDSDDEVTSVQKSKKKRKNKSYADEVWVTGFSQFYSCLYCMSESVCRIFSRVTAIQARRVPRPRRLPGPLRQRSRGKITRLSQRRKRGTNPLQRLPLLRL